MVSVGDGDYILTAEHVWKKFENAVGMGITLDKEDEDHKFFIRVDKIIAYGPELISDRDPWGPDMRLLRIPPEARKGLRDSKRFYPLNLDIPDPPNVSSLEIWMLMGAPHEQSKRLPKHVSLTMNGIFATIRSEYNFGGLDYFDLDMNISFLGIPKTTR